MSLISPTTSLLTVSSRLRMPPRSFHTRLCSLSSSTSRSSSCWASLPVSVSLRRNSSDVMRSYRSEEHTSELQSHVNLVCRLLLEKKKKKITTQTHSNH